MNMRLFSVLTLLVFTVFFVICIWNWATHAKESSEESLRDLRVQLQRAQQMQLIISNPESQLLIEELPTSLHSFKLDLVEFLVATSDYQGVSENQYELTMHHATLGESSQYPVSITQLALDFTAQHSLSAIDYLTAGKEVIKPWPVDVRSCDIRLMLNDLLNVSCRLDIYHWWLEDV